MERLKPLVLLDSVGCEEWKDLRLWILIVAGIKTEGEDRELFIEAIQGAMVGISIETWEMVEEVVKSILWIEEIYGEKCVGLGLNVMRGRSK